MSDHVECAKAFAEIEAENVQLRAEVERAVTGWKREKEQMLLQIGELVQALQHMNMCGSCGEDSWDICDGGRQAQAALDKATAAQKPQCGLPFYKDGENPIPCDFEVPCPRHLTEKPRSESGYGWSSDPTTDTELQAKYGDSVHKPKTEKRVEGSQNETRPESPVLLGVPDGRPSVRLYVPEKCPICKQEACGHFNEPKP